MKELPTQYHTGAKGPDCNPASEWFDQNTCGPREEIYFDPVSGCAYRNGQFLSDVSGLGNCYNTEQPSNYYREFASRIDTGNVLVSLGVSGLLVGGIILYRFRRRFL